VRYSKHVLLAAVLWLFFWGALGGSESTFSISTFAAVFQFCKMLISWAFKERAVLRVGGFSHHKLGEGASPYMYREGDVMQFEMTIEEKDLGAYYVGV
jgi:hypothetical protein